MRVLAIDPGFGRCGVAVLEGSATCPTLLYSACIETDSKQSFPERLLAVANEIVHLIEKHTPDTIAIEEIYFTNNAKTAIHVAEIRGMLIYVATARTIPLVEYNPLTVKLAITGYGRATKEQMTRMVEKLVHITTTLKYDDEYDAIALGITSLAHARHNAIQK